MHTDIDIDLAQEGKHLPAYGRPSCLKKRGAMTSLRDEPAGQVRSMVEFFSIAHAMELDAATRYTETSRQLRTQGETALAEIFDGLAETERGHIRQVDQWADQEETPPNATPPWAIPDTFDATPNEMAGTNLLTPYQALASAVRHEQRSFAFWTYVAAHAESLEVKDAAERMALEELEHVSLLRRERRKAFHAGRISGEPAGEVPVTLAALAARERRLADLIEGDSSTNASRRGLASQLAAAARGSASKLEGLHAKTKIEFSAPPLPSEGPREVGALMEHLAEAYLRLAEVSQDSNVLSCAQELANTAIYRLGALVPEQQSDETE